MRKPLELIDTLTGSVVPTFSSAAPSGWKLLNGDTIGNTGSTATHKSETLRSLYLVLWGVASVTVAGGKGANAAADWTANKNLTLPDLRGRAVIGAGTGSGLTARTLGVTGGAETHALDATQMPSHHHRLWGTTEGTSTNAKSLGNGGSNSVGGFSGSGPTGDWRDQHPATSIQIMEDTGGGVAHNNMQPFLALNYLVKE